MPRIPSRHKALRDFYPQFAWRENGFTRQRETLEVSTHAPGHLGNLAGKRAYRHTDNDDAPEATNDYGYAYDPVGNVWVILSDDGEEVSWFSQDAFGNELSIAPFAGTSWSTAQEVSMESNNLRASPQTFVDPTGWTRPPGAGCSPPPGGLGSGVDLRDSQPGPEQTE